MTRLFCAQCGDPRIAGGEPCEQCGIQNDPVPMDLDLRTRTRRAYRGSEARLARWKADGDRLVAEIGPAAAKAKLQAEIDELFK